MSKEQNTGAPKPLNCMYCENATFSRPVPMACFKPSQPYPVCCSYDVAPELIDLALLQIEEIDIPNWLPYNCGHFIPRLVRQSCRICKKTFIMPEWKLVQKQYLTFCLTMVCSNECHIMYINGGSDA